MLQQLLVLCIYDWLTLGKPATYLQRIDIEKYRSIIQSVISREGLKLQTYNLLWIYSYLIAIGYPLHNSQLVEFPTILDSFYQHQKHL